MAKAKKKKLLSDIDEMLSLCSDELLRKLGLNPNTTGNKALQELADREQKNLSK